MAESNTEHRTPNTEHRPRNLALIGYRGVGKTAVAQRLALRLGWRWIDADVELEFEAGKSIAAIFADEGEAAFRELESRVLARLVKEDATVLALGGGVVLRPENRERLTEVGRTIWLTASPETIAARLAGCETTATRRPNLTAMGGIEEIEQLLKDRTPLYRQCAQVTIDTERKIPAAVAGEILDKLALRQTPAS